ncbi:YbhB/YbcL family Raf kinase inhibitor-like protein [uncultured Litoreibacter sp.]|uniref:YbhB/YbcL family Raf kinase inhibitor-like protein n=1 Tax=uncultured Litoreibacter sp. TaxID=1392394 RepID=UPI0026129DC2|nr:YbhB/YbcL family Raf kinase inhibitor-like protein [uncultured Litoreibacter sp.]
MFRNTLAILALIASSTSSWAEMTLESDSFEANGTLSEAQVFNSFGCSGKNQSPHLKWSGAPEGTQSYVITVFDPDAPTGSGWWHWTVFNVPAGVTQLPEGWSGSEIASVGNIVQGRTDFGFSAFGGVCPPSGASPHRYVFSVYAMPQKELPINSDASGALVGFYALSQNIDFAEITANYGRE